MGKMRGSNRVWEGVVGWSIAVVWLKFRVTYSAEGRRHCCGVMGSGTKTQARRSIR